MEEDLNTNIQDLRAPITTFGIYVAIGVTVLILGLLYFLKLDHVPIGMLLIQYYLKGRR